MNLPPGLWQGGLLALVGGSIQAYVQGEAVNVTIVGTWIVLGGLIGMGVAKLWSKRRR